MSFPHVRMRRLRKNALLRRMVRETRLSVDHLIYPMFVRPGKGERRPISSLKDQFQYSPDTLVEKAREVADLGIPGIILFGIPERKDAVGSDSLSEKGIIAESIRALKHANLDLLIIADVCFCEYTDHGHCGVIRNGEVDNDATLENIGRQALNYARAGADLIAPSDMMDGRVAKIRGVLDSGGFENLPILSYAAKYASVFYGPFREAAESPPQFGDRRGYQMDPANTDEALRECALDVEEGADILMVKPALPYLDIIHRVKERFPLPLAAYCVSGEFAMIEAAAERGLLDRKGAVLEALVSIKRAGADIILSYWAPEVARWLAREGNA